MTAPALCAPWVTPEDLLAQDCQPDCFAQLTPEDTRLVNACNLASRILFNLTGYIFTGSCETQVRPSRRWLPHGGPAWGPTVTPPANLAQGGWWGWGGYPWVWDRSWGNCGCGHLGRACSCGELDAITLGVDPIISIDEVWVDGVHLTAGTDYRLDEKRWLVRAPDHFWPSCSDIWAPKTDPDTFVVILHYGTVPDAGAEAAGLIYATEIAQACCGAECNLPSRVSSVLRQGTTVTFVDPTRLTQAGLTGVPLVDTWIMAQNGGRAKAPVPATIASPDVPRRVWKP